MQKCEDQSENCQNIGTKKIFTKNKLAYFCWFYFNTK